MCQVASKRLHVANSAGLHGFKATSMMHALRVGAREGGDVVNSCAAHDSFQHSGSRIGMGHAWFWANPETGRLVASTTRPLHHLPMGRGTTAEIMSGYSTSEVVWAGSTVCISLPGKGGGCFCGGRQLGCGGGPRSEACVLLSPAPLAWSSAAAGCCARRTLASSR